MISNSLPPNIHLSHPPLGDMQMLSNSSFLIDLWSRDQASDGVVRIQLSRLLKWLHPLRLSF